MDLNLEIIDEMIDRLEEIQIEMWALRTLQLAYPGRWNDMVAINRQYKALKLERICIVAMLEDEYEQLDIQDIMLQLL